MLELLSIIIVGRDQQTSLESLLRQLHLLECAKEIIYVDLGSSDESLSRAGLYAHRIYQSESLKGIALQNAALAMASNHAEYDWILSLDASCRLSEEFMDYLNQGQFRRCNKDTGAVVGYAFADGDLWEPTQSFFWFRWSQLGSPLYNGILWRKSHILASGNWNTQLEVHGAYELLFRVASMSNIEKLNFGTVALGSVQVDEVLHPIRRTSQLFWAPLIQLKWGLWFRMHPWWISSFASVFYLFFQSDFYSFVFWVLAQLLLLISYGSAIQMATYARWLYWLLFPLNFTKRVQFTRIPVSNEILYRK